MKADAATVRERCLARPGADEGRPFGPDALVCKVGGRIFAIIADHADPPTVSLKCEPELADVLREAHAAVSAGYHLNKRHWITVALDGSVPAEDVLGWLEDSYDLVVDGLPARTRTALRGAAPPDQPRRSSRPRT